MVRTAVLMGAFALAVVAGVASAHTRWYELEKTNYGFEDYVKEFNKEYGTDAEHEARRAVFSRRLSEIKAHNARGASWNAGVNHLTDRTEDELTAMRGYRRDIGYSLTGDGQFDEQEEARKFAALDVPDSMDWRTKGVVSGVKDQGQCGSCWTFATAETVESHFAIKYGADMLSELSEQQVASCSPNPKDCGGTGGCEGGTAEVGFQGIIDANGIASEWTYPYTSYSGHDSACKDTGLTKVAKLTGYKKLGVNSYSDLLNTVANVGPVAISVDASAWSTYEGGVFDGGNSTDMMIDHAVQLVGYGTDSSGGDYWLVRNSWSPTWGESGYIRLKRFGSATAHCGVDTQPGDGTGCNGGPSVVKVCGQNAILYDNCIPQIA